MLRHAVINKEGIVKNVIIWDGISPWNPPKDHITVQHDSVDVNDTYDFDKKIIIKNIVISSDPIEIVAEKQVSLEDLQKQIDVLKAQLIHKV